MPHVPESSIPEYTEEIVQVVWSIPSVFNVAGGLARGVVIINQVETIDGKKKESIRAYSVSDQYSLCLLPEEQLKKAMYVWDTVRQTKDVRIVCIAATRAMSERSLRNALFDADMLGGKEYAKAKARQYAESGKSDRRRFLDLDDKVPFGQYGPNGAKSNDGEALTIREVIDKNRGWVIWAIKEFGSDFLNAPAMKYFNEKRIENPQVRKYAKHRK